MNGNKLVPGGSVVQLTFIGYDTKQKPVYTFVWNPRQPEDGLVPIHDHRDNVTGGGFAFSVYHPGTSLPQQPWSV